MTTKILSGTYSNGYTLAAAYAGVSVTSSGSITNVTGTQGANGYNAGSGGPTGPALSLGVGNGTLTNRGQIRGGAGGSGGVEQFNYYNGQYYQGAFGNGANGGAGVQIAGPGRITNFATITGGAGGSGGPSQYVGGGNGGAGGAGILCAGTSTITNDGLISGGAGGYFGYGSHFFFAHGSFGAGGTGVVLQAGGVVTNRGTIAGSATQMELGYYYAGGDGVEASGGVITNGDVSHRSAVISGGVGVALSGPGTVINFATITGNGYGDGRIAVLMGSAADVVIGKGGSDFVGAVSGGGGKLELLGGGTGSLDGVGGGIGAVDVAAGASWILDGRTTISAGWTIASASTLTVVGILSGQGDLRGTTVNDGTLAVGGGQTLSLRGGVLANLAGGVLTGGAILVGPTSVLRLADNEPITALDATLALSVGAMVESLDTSTMKEITVEQSLATVGATGTIDLASGAGTVTMAGLTNLSSGTLTGGIFALGAVLRLADNDPITTLNAAVEMFGSNGAIESYDTSTSTAITLRQSLATIGANGTLETDNGYWTAGASLGNAGQIIGNGFYEAGLDFAAMSTIDNAGLIEGGIGGTKAGAAGVWFEAGGSAINTGTIEGGGGGEFGSGGGAGIVLDVGGAITNLGLIEGGEAGKYTGPQGVGVAAAAGDIVNGSATNATALIEGSVGVSLSGAGTVVDFGTIDGTAGTAVRLGSASDTLIAYGGADLVGKVAGGGGALELKADAPGTIGAITGFATVTVAAGASWTVGGSTTITSGWTMASTSTLTVTGTLTDAGTFDQAGFIELADGALVNKAGATWTLADGVLLAAGDKGKFTNAGTLVRGAVTSANHIAADFINTGTVQIGSGTLFVDGPANSLAGTVTGAGTLGFGGGVSTLGPDLTLTTAAVSIKGAATSVILDETLTWAGGWTQSGGSVSIASGDTLKFTGAGDSFSGTVTGAGTVDFAAGSDSFKTLALSTAHTAIGAATVTLTGGIGVSGLVTATGSSFTIAATGAAVSGGGMLQLLGAADAVVGATTTATLTNADRIMGAGHIGGGSMILLNQGAGVIDGTGALSIDTGAQSIVNAGLIEATGAGVVSVASAVNNSGVLEAAKGTLIVNGVVTGAGKLMIENGGTADFASAFTENVTFAVGGGTLELASSQGYSGTITGFANTGAKLDLADIDYGAGTKATYSGTTSAGVLTVTDGTHTAKIHLAGNFTGSTWILAGDGHGGTTVVDPPAAGTADAAPLASAIASFAPAAIAPMATAQPVHVGRDVLGLIAAPA
jgi:hypothetical protein